jgi:hypothetical protein
METDSFFVWFKNTFEKFFQVSGPDGIELGLGWVFLVILGFVIVIGSVFGKKRR